MSWGVLGSALWVLPLCPSPRMASGGVSFPPPTLPLCKAQLETDCIGKNTGLGLAHSLLKHRSSQMKTCRLTFSDSAVFPITRDASDVRALESLPVTFQTPLYFFPLGDLVREPGPR